MKKRLDQFLTLKAKVAKSPFVSTNFTAAQRSGLIYWRYRCYRPFLKLKYQRFQKQNPDLPWLAPDAIEILKALLNGGHGLEYGSGRSTVFFAGLLDQLDSVEHHEGWYQKVKTLLSDKQIENTTLHFVPPNEDVNLPKLSSEQQVFMGENEYPVKDEVFNDYIQVLDRFTDSSLDFILVDGRARKSCCMKAIDKLAPGGLLVLDNSERQRYKTVHEAFSKLPAITTTTGLTDTTIWLKE